MPTVNMPALPQTDAVLYTIIGVFMAVMAIIWLLLGSGTTTSGPGYSAGPSFGLFIGLVAAVVVAIGGFLKRSEPQPATPSYSTPGPGTGYGGGMPPPAP
jgi:drug/metabolite transporter (DMT)-like permease